MSHHLPRRKKETEWVVAPTPARLGDVEVKVVSAKVAPVALRGPSGEGQSKEPQLILTIEVSNANLNRKIDYSTWAGADVPLERDFATLTDNFENSYKRITFGIFDRPIGRVVSDSIYPGKSLTDALVFEAPLGNIEHLDLDMPGKNIGTNGLFKIRIPAAMIQELEKTRGEHARTKPLAAAPTPGNGSRVPPLIGEVPDGFTASHEAGIHSSGWPLVILSKRDGAPMVLVPAGTFLMGNDDGPPAEDPAHKVRLSTYYIDQHEVTVRQFQLFLPETHYRGHPDHVANWSEDFRKSPSDTLPMVMVNARDAQAYADWALKKLPTEAQWEMAARSTDGRLYPWGSDPKAGGRKAGDWKLQPINASAADVSPFGVHDMGGNVLEWTKDWFDSKFYRQLPLGDVDNPTGPATRPRSLELVVKGDRKSGSAASRQGMMLEKRLNYVGFRCVLPVVDQPVVTSGPVAPGSVPPAAPPGQPPGSSPQP